MELRIKNRLIVAIHKFLYEIPLKGKQSRHRTRFIKKLENKLQEVQQEEHEIRKQYCILDDDGEPKTTELPNNQVSLVFEDNNKKQDYWRERHELMDEEFIIDDADSQAMLDTIKIVLHGYDGEMSGDDADVYDYLCEKFGIE